MKKFPEPAADRQTGTVVCDECGQIHTADFSHMGTHDPRTAYYAVLCPADGLTGYYADFRVAFAPATPQTAPELELELDR